MRPSTRQYSGVSPDAGTATADVRDNSESMVGTLHAALAGSRGLSASAASVQSRNCQLFWARTVTVNAASACNANLMIRPPSTAEKPHRRSRDHEIRRNRAGDRQRCCSPAVFLLDSWTPALL